MSKMKIKAFDELMSMTKRELAVILVDAKIEAGVIGTPADRDDYEAYLVKTLRKPEMIDHILILRDEIEHGNDAENNDDASVTHVQLWPESTTPVAMTIDESDAMRLSEDGDPRAFVEAWVLDGMPELDYETQRAIDEQVERYADEYDDLDDEFDDVWEAAEIQEHLYQKACEELIKLSKPELSKMRDGEKKAFSGVSIEWADEDEKALRDLHSLWAYEFDDDDADEMLGDEWTEWLVLAGELERVDSGDEQTTPVWAWCPDWRAELPGSDKPFAHLDEAKVVFDAFDPMGLWFTKRHIEAKEGEEPQLWRRYEVDLVCQTCSRDADGLISVRDDAVRLSKSFDVDGDKAAQTLIASILSHI